MKGEFSLGCGWISQDGFGTGWIARPRRGGSRGFFVPSRGVRPERTVRDFRRGVVSELGKTIVYFVSRAAISSSRWSIALHAAIASNGFIILATSVW